MIIRLTFCENLLKFSFVNFIKVFAIFIFFIISNKQNCLGSANLSNNVSRHLFNKIDFNQPQSYEYKLLLSSQNFPKIFVINSTDKIDLRCIANKVSNLIFQKISTINPKPSHIPCIAVIPNNKQKIKYQYINFLDLHDYNLFNQSITIRIRKELEEHEKNSKNDYGNLNVNKDCMELTLKIRSPNKYELIRKKEVINQKKFSKTKFEVDVVIGSDEKLNYYYSLSYATVDTISYNNQIISSFFYPNLIKRLINKSHVKYTATTTLKTVTKKFIKESSLQIAKINILDKIETKLLFSMWEIPIKSKSSPSNSYNNKNESLEKIFELSFSIKFENKELSDNDKIAIIELSNKLYLEIYKIFIDCVIPQQTKTDWLFTIIKN